MSTIKDLIVDRMLLDGSSPSGVKWKARGDRPEVSAGALKDGSWVITTSGIKLDADAVKAVLSGADVDDEDLMPKQRVKIVREVVVKPAIVRARSGLKGVKIIKKNKNNGVTGYLPRIKRKDFSWTGDIQTDKRVAAAMVDAKLIEIDGDKAVTNKSLGLI